MKRDESKERPTTLSFDCGHENGWAETDNLYVEEVPSKIEFMFNTEYGDIRINTTIDSSGYAVNTKSIHVSTWVGLTQIKQLHAIIGDFINQCEAND